MRVLQHGWLIASLLLSPALAQGADRTVVFGFDRPGLAVPSYTFVVHENGSGTYQTVLSPLPGGTPDSVPALPSVAAGEMRPLTLSAATTAKLFEQARSLNLFRKACASKAKNIADTGAKTLTYTGPEGTGTCSFNYTENKTVAALAQTFQTMAGTLDAGDRLERMHRFDRLGLDQEIQRLVDAVQGGRASELSLIAPTLRAIADDPLVLERVRAIAVKLLQSGATSH